MKKLDVSKNVGQRIAKLRKVCDLTQVELAASLGVSQSLLAYYESGRRNIPLAVVVSCAERLGVSAAELLGESASLLRKPGPKSVLEKQLNEIQKLPRSEQHFVSKLLHKVLVGSTEE